MKNTLNKLLQLLYCHVGIIHWFWLVIPLLKLFNMLTIFSTILCMTIILIDACHFFVIRKCQYFTTIETLVNFIKSKLRKKNPTELQELISAIGVKHPTLLDVLKFHKPISQNNENVYSHFLCNNAVCYFILHERIDEETGHIKIIDEIMWNTNHQLLEKQSSELIIFLHKHNIKKQI